MYIVSSNVDYPDFRSSLVNRQQCERDDRENSVITSRVTRTYWIITGHGSNGETHAPLSTICMDIEQDTDWISDIGTNGGKLENRSRGVWKCEEGRGGKGDSGIKSERKQRVDPKQVVAEGGRIIANWESTPSPREIQTMTKPPPPPRTDRL